MSDDLIRRSDLLKEFGEEPYVWDGHDREQVQERNDWEYYTGLVKAAPAVTGVFCIGCDKHQPYRVEKRVINNTIKGVPIVYNERYAVCAECGEEIYISVINDLNVWEIYSALIESWRKVENAD